MSRPTTEQTAKAMDTLSEAWVTILTDQQKQIATPLMTGASDAGWNELPEEVAKSVRILRASVEKLAL